MFVARKNKNRNRDNRIVSRQRGHTGVTFEGPLKLAKISMFFTFLRQNKQRSVFYCLLLFDFNHRFHIFIFQSNVSIETSQASQHPAPHRLLFRYIFHIQITFTKTKLILSMFILSYVSSKYEESKTTRHEHKQ